MKRSERSTLGYDDESTGGRVGGLHAELKREIRNLFRILIEKLPLL